MKKFSIFRMFSPTLVLLRKMEEIRKFVVLTSAPVPLTDACNPTNSVSRLVNSLRLPKETTYENKLLIITYAPCKFLQVTRTIRQTFVE